jgi:long-chain fatty acid transport protein
MKTIALTSVFLLTVMMAFADGLVTRTNQSVQFVRMLSRNASTGIDAVYYNPGGLMKLENGIHLAFYDQFLIRSETLMSGYETLNDPECSVKIRQPFFPTGFAVYKNDRMAFSFGFVQTAGAGKVSYDQGLPSLELPLAKAYQTIPLKVRTSHLVKGYDAGISFNSNTSFPGIQLGLTILATDLFSVYGGVRILPAKNSYDGSADHVRLIVGTDSVAAPGWLTATGAGYDAQALTARNTASQLNAAATQVQQLITAGAGAFTISQVQIAGYISSAQRAQLEAALTSVGFTPAQVAAMNMNQVKANFTSKSAEYTNMAASHETTADKLIALSSLLADRSMQVEQTGTGFTPVFGMNISPVENMNISVRYEMKTELKLTNKTVADDWGLYPDGEEMSFQIPAMLALGVGFEPVGWLKGQLSFNLHFDKGVEWGLNTRDMLSFPEVPDLIREREVEKNSFELGLGLELSVDDNFSLSLGGLYSKTGVAESYQSDFGFAGPSFTVGGGIVLKVSDNLSFDAGVSYAFIDDLDVLFWDPYRERNYQDRYGRTALSIAAGLSYRIAR